MEGYFSEKPDTHFEHIDLTLKLSPYGQNAEEKMVGEKAKSNIMANEAQEGSYVLCLAEGEKGLVRFGDLQTMRRVRTGKRLLLKKLQRAVAAAAAEMSPAGALPLPHEIDDSLKMFATPFGDSWHDGGASFNVHTKSNKQQNDCMVSPKAMQEMTLWPSETMIERQAKRLKHVNSYDKSDSMDNIVRETPIVITTGDCSTGKRIEGLLYTYKRGQVCIVCVCHGSFLSPTEFVMHAGGKEVADPMKHITVCSDPFYIKGAP